MGLGDVATESTHSRTLDGSLPRAARRHPTPLAPQRGVLAPSYRRPVCPRPWMLGVAALQEREFTLFLSDVLGWKRPGCARGERRVQGMTSRSPQAPGLGEAGAARGAEATFSVRAGAPGSQRGRTKSAEVACPAGRTPPGLPPQFTAKLYGGRNRKISVSPIHKGLSQECGTGAKWGELTGVGVAARCSHLATSKLGCLTYPARGPRSRVQSGSVRGQSCPGGFAVRPGVPGARGAGATGADQGAFCPGSRSGAVLVLLVGG